MDHLEARLIELQADARSVRVPPKRADVEALEAVHAAPAREPDRGPEFSGVREW
jgi:hypothetical protein